MRVIERDTYIAILKMAEATERMANNQEKLINILVKILGDDDD